MRGASGCTSVLGPVDLRVDLDNLGSAPMPSGAGGRGMGVRDLGLARLRWAG